jgi:hypothetical protein
LRAVVAHLNRSGIVLLLKELVPQNPVGVKEKLKGVSDVGPWAGNYVRGFVLGNTYQCNDPG